MKSQLTIQQHQLIGWVYRCVQDHAGVLPLSDFSSLESPQSSFEADWEVTLSDWIVEAIDRGEYTPDQVQKLVEQKIGVKRAIFAQARRETPPSSRSSSESSTESATGDYSTFSTLPTLNTTLDEELRSADQNEKTDDSRDGEPSLQAGSRMSIQLNTCDWKCCHACRPTYRERAWQILDKVATEPYQEPPSWELENRPISDARELVKIGLPKTHEPYEEFGFLIDAAFADTTQLDDSAFSPDNMLTRQRTHSFRHKSDFEEAVRGVISLGAEESRFANQHNRQVSSSSSHGSLARASRSMLFMRNASSPSNAHAATGCGPSTSQLSLTHTVTDGGEVEDGVAVTEEALHLRTADIIMQI